MEAGRMLMLFILTNSSSMQCRYNNDNDNNYCQRNKYITIFYIQHEVDLSLQTYPPFFKQRTFFMNLEIKIHKPENPNSKQALAVLPD